MKPLPAQKDAGGAPSPEAIPSLPSALPSSSGPYSKANRRTNHCPLQRAYPLLLAGSTAVAALFCLMYITKPVIVAKSDGTATVTAKPAFSLAGNTPAPHESLLPGAGALPGETATTENAATKPSTGLPAPGGTSSFEETNLRIQHVLTAEAPGGHLARIDLDVPVLYQSRQLRWNPGEVAEARTLLLALMDYQEKSRALREEGVGLLNAWTRLVDHSIPTTALRADSPSLPANQESAAVAPLPTTLNTGESVQLEPAGK